MNREFLEYYRDELQYIRELAGEFAQDYPKIAGRLELDPTGAETCPDPFVERLLEGFAFLTARVQMKYDAEYPRAVQALFDTIVPQYLSPLPSMAMVQFSPDFDDADLVSGYPVPRHTSLRSRLGRGERTPCTFRTAHALKLFPLRVVEAKYFSRDLGVLELGNIGEVRAAMQIRIEATAGAKIADIEAEELEFFVRGSGNLPDQILEQIFSDLVGVGYRSGNERHGLVGTLPVEAVEPVGLANEESLLPIERRLFSGYRQLREYFAFRQRYHFFRLKGLRDAFRQVDDNTIDLFLLLRQSRLELEPRLDRDVFSLFTTPVVNLFDRRADAIQLRRDSTEYPIIVDKTRSFDFEVFGVGELVGRGSLAEESMPFHPFYFSPESAQGGDAFYSLRRAPRQPTAQEKRFGKLSTYTGSELFVSIVDGACRPYSPDLQQLFPKVICSNRHLPLNLHVSGGENDFSCELGGPIAGIACIIDPTEPQPSATEGDFTWRLISHLSLNHFSLVDRGDGQAAVALREMLKLYGEGGRRNAEGEIQSLTRVSTRAVTQRAPTPGPISFARGLEVTLSFNEERLEGVGIYGLGLVLSRFLANYVSINSFTETVINSEQRGEVMRWQRSLGNMPIV